MGDKLLIVADLNYGDMICIDEENNVRFFILNLNVSDKISLGSNLFPTL